MRKIYYVPGLISAMLIPVLFWYYGSQKLKEANVRVMDIGLPSKLEKDGSNYLYSFESLRNWDYKKIKVNPHKAKENSKFYVSEIKALQKRNQKETGIEFILDKNNTYGDFASLLNDMAITKQETYAYDLEKTGHIFAVHYYKDPNAKEVECLLCNDAIYTYVEPTFKDRFFKLPKEAFFIIFGFLLFLNISMLSIKERFQLN